MAAADGGGKRITQNEFTDKAWQAIIAAPETAKQVLLLPGSPSGSASQEDVPFRSQTCCSEAHLAVGNLVMSSWGDARSLASW